MPQKVVNLLIILAILLVSVVFAFPYLSKVWTNRTQPNEQSTTQSNLEQSSETKTNQDFNPNSTNSSEINSDQPNSEKSNEVNENTTSVQNRGNYDEMKDAYSRDII
jgi:Tfp pilus assembly protein FimT